MRTLIGLGILAAVALPTVVLADTPCDGAQSLLATVQTERYRLEGESSKQARVAAKYLRKGEKALGKLVRRYQADPSIEHTKLALFVRAGQWIERARLTGEVADDSAPVTGWAGWYDGCMVDIEGFVDGAVDERDRLITETFREKVTRRLERGLALYDDAISKETALERARRMVTAVQQIGAAYQKARKLCAKESKPNCPSGLVADNNLLMYRGRGTLTVFDLEWHITLRTAAGVLVAERNGKLTDPGRLLPVPLPWRLDRGEALDGLDAANISTTQGHRIDGVLIWTTSGGQVEVPVHVDP